MNESAGLIEVRTHDDKLLCRVSQDGTRLEIVRRGRRYAVDLLAAWLSAERVVEVQPDDLLARETLLD